MSPAGRPRLGRIRRQFKLLPEIDALLGQLAAKAKMTKSQYLESLITQQQQTKTK